MSKKSQDEAVQEAEVIEPKANDIAGDEQTTAVVNWEERLAGAAEEAAQEETIQGTWMSTRAGRLTIDKTPVAGNVLDCIIIAYARENAWYKGKFDPNNPVPPDCYAIQPVHGPQTNEDDMEPHVDVDDPVDELCFRCPKNEWKSGDGGKGKACKNVRRFALLPADAAKSAKAMMEADVIYLKIPVMSVRNWSKYSTNVSAEFKRPYYAMVSQISTEPDAQSQFKVTFKPGYKISDPEVLQALLERRERELKTIDFPYQAPTVTAPAEESEKF